MSGPYPASTTELYPALADYVARRVAEFGLIDAPRRTLLEELAAFVRAGRLAGAASRLIFVCTHNSRRSHMAHLWTAVAAVACRQDVEAYSGGTEATAFNPRAVAAMEWAGFRIHRTSGVDNPRYAVRFGDYRPGITCFSKRYDEYPNPTRDFAAIMVCGEADAACPTVPGAAARFYVPYVDPKAGDDTPAEGAIYDDRCAQVAREMLYAMCTVER